MKKQIMVIDAETDGLWGKPFCIAAIIYELGSDQCWTRKQEVCFRYNADVDTEWVINNVLPVIEHIPVTHAQGDSRRINYLEMLADFGMWYMHFKNGCEIVWHMGGVVETFLFREMVRVGAIGEWDAPYTPIEVSTLLMSVGEAPDSVEKYVAKHLPSCDMSGKPHDPTHDCEVTAHAFFHLTKRLNFPIYD